jgi:hypothetical protein
MIIVVDSRFDCFQYAECAQATIKEYRVNVFSPYISCTSGCVLYWTFGRIYRNYLPSPVTSRDSGTEKEEQIYLLTRYKPGLTVKRNNVIWMKNLENCFESVRYSTSGYVG